MKKTITIRYPGIIPNSFVIVLEENITNIVGLKEKLISITGVEYAFSTVGDSCEIIKELDVHLTKGYEFTSLLAEVTSKLLDYFPPHIFSIKSEDNTEEIKEIEKRFDQKEHLGFVSPPPDVFEKIVNKIFNSHL